MLVYSDNIKLSDTKKKKEAVLMALNQALYVLPIRPGLHPFYSGKKPDLPPDFQKNPLMRLEGHREMHAFFREQARRLGWRDLTGDGFCLRFPLDTAEFLHTLVQSCGVVLYLPSQDQRMEAYSANHQAIDLAFCKKAIALLKRGYAAYYSAY